MKKNDNKKTVAEIVTQRFIDALALGSVPWFRPWEMWSSWSRATGNDYRGANAMLLTGGEYVTFKQAKEQGIKIEKGAKSEMIVKYTEYMQKISKADFEAQGLTVTDRVEDCGEFYKVPAKSIRYYNVFSVDRCTDAEPKHEHKQPSHEWEPVAKAEAIADAYREAHNITIEHCGNKAYNRDSLFEGGHVQLPKREQFKKVEEYYSTLFHELIHSTADFVKRDKSQYASSKKARAREELVAEIGAAYILSFLGMETEYSVANSQAYVGNWAKALKSDPNAILWAAPKAIEAAELILSAAPEEGEEPETMPAETEYNAGAIEQAKAGKLTKGEFYITINGKEGAKAEKVAGYVTEINGVAVGFHKRSSAWIGTDLKSGAGITAPHSTRAAAIQQAEEITTRYGEKLQSMRASFTDKIQQAAASIAA